MRTEASMFLFYNSYRGRVKSNHHYWLDGTEDIFVVCSDDMGYHWTQPQQEHY